MFGVETSTLVKSMRNGRMFGDTSVLAVRQGKMSDDASSDRVEALRRSAVELFGIDLHHGAGVPPREEAISYKVESSEVIQSDGPLIGTITCPNPT